MDLAASVLVALLEGLQRGDGLAAEAEGAGDLDPVKLKSSASLFREKVKISSLVRESPSPGAHWGLLHVATNSKTSLEIQLRVYTYRGHCGCFVGDNRGAEMMVDHGVVQLCRAAPGQALLGSRDSHFVPGNGEYRVILAK